MKALWGGVLLLGSAVVWALLPGLHPGARLWTVLLLVPFPALMVRQAQQLRQMPALPRRAAYLSSILALWLLCGATLLIAVLSGFDARDLGVVPASPAVIATATLATTGAAVAVLFLFRLAGTRETPVLRELLPVTAPERALFVLLSLTAGICEELVFRGFLLRSLTLATGLTPLAVLLSAGAFGVVHAYQQPAGAVRAALMGVLLSLPVLFDASLISSMAAHALVDLLSGLWLAKYLLR